MHLTEKPGAKTAIQPASAAAVFCGPGASLISGKCSATEKTNSREILPADSSGGSAGEQSLAVSRGKVSSDGYWETLASMPMLLLAR